MQTCYLQIRQKLRFKNRIVVLSAFDFENDRVLNNQVNPVFANHTAFVRNGINHLSLKFQACQLKLDTQSRFIG